MGMARSIKFKEILPGILSLEFLTQKELTLTMFRIQEFYESKYKNIRNKKFSIEQFLDSYMEKDGEIGYFSFYSGFNIPGDVFSNFFNTFTDLTRREKKLKKIVMDNINTNKLFYVICSKIGDAGTLRHEIAHALYYIKPNYKKEVNKVVSTIPKSIIGRITKYLKRMDYNQSVFKDEIQAY